MNSCLWKNLSYVFAPSLMKIVTFKMINTQSSLIISTLIKHGQENEWVIQFAWHSVKIPYYCLKTGLMIKQLDPPLPSLSLFLRHQLMPNKFHQQKRVNAADIIPVQVSLQQVANNVSKTIQHEQIHLRMCSSDERFDDSGRKVCLLLWRGN